MIRLDRRALLSGGALSLAMMTAGGRMAWAVAAAPTDQRFVLVILRGAMDGLGAVPPYGDPDYASSRPNIALGAPGGAEGSLDLGGFFGLNPGLKPIHPWFASNELLVVHAVAGAYRGRSHFDAQDLLESGGATPHAMDTGWLNRALASLRGSGEPMGLALGQTVPLALRGSAPVSSWAPDVLPAANGDLLAQLGELYRHDPVLSVALQEGLATQARVEGMGDAGGGRGDGAKAFVAMATMAGKMLAAPTGPRIATLEIGGWDTHVGQGAANGRLGRQLAVLADGLVALRAGLGDAWGRTVILAATEFGRTVAANGTGGTDHGTGGAAFLMGGAVAGGRVVANWPGLSRDKLLEGRDLAPTTDLRSVAKAVLNQHLGIATAALDTSVFPDSRGVAATPGLIRSVG